MCAIESIGVRSKARPPLLRQQIHSQQPIGFRQRGWVCTNFTVVCQKNPDVAYKLRKGEVKENSGGPLNMDIN
jgi:hypothetical protein